MPPSVEHLRLLLVLCLGSPQCLGEHGSARLDLYPWRSLLGTVQPVELSLGEKLCAFSPRISVASCRIKAQHVWEGGQGTLHWFLWGR